MPWHIDVLKYAIQRSKRGFREVVCSAGIEEPDRTRILHAISKRQQIDWWAVRPLGTAVNMRFYWGVRGPLVMFDANEAVEFIAAFRRRLGWRRTVNRTGWSKDRIFRIERGLISHEQIALIAEVRGVRYW